MNNHPTPTEIITIVALLVGPLMAVIITLWQQSRGEKRSAKARLFAMLMAHRRSNPPPIEYVNSLNLIDVVFRDNPAVVSKWRELYDLLNHPHAQINWIQVGHARIELLSEMATCLGYRRLRQIDIDRFYMPQALETEAAAQKELRDELMRVLKDTKSLSSVPKK
jgi:hypothetical protein